MLLDDVFEGDDGVVVSMTSHSGAIGSLLVGLGHRVSPLFSPHLSFLRSVFRWHSVGEEGVGPWMRERKMGTNWDFFLGICARDGGRDTRVC